uniref:Bardet-Biedl syndrome 2 protein homolog n=1 Tax=Eutreptiella gymnastica TaxID=73025 RepID=A0A7S1IWS5_9EUGL|mmetsp:Transcript_49413/g.88294  ORF Transcript_49413/g.88294 Transcript_49413/m.88294 type:complete len:717 (+) Transcript_49413:62-2212(+)
MSKASQLTPAFELTLKNTIQEGLATVAKFNGEQPCLTCATAGGKVFIHNPHERGDLTVEQPSADAQKNIKYLNINRTVTALASGPLNPKSKNDILLVGTQTNLLAYDVEQNKDVFYREVPDGINSMTFGKVGSIEDQLAIVGGNCSIQGFDADGNELFWTVTGDNVTALALIDIDEDQQNELLVGSEDYEIRIFQNEEVISETTETDRLLALSPLYGTRFGYALGNGTIGIYDRATRVWRFKSKHQVVCVDGYDLDADGVPELISGWHNGKVEVRSDKNGEVLFRDAFNSAVSAVLIADYRMDGQQEVICCAHSGDVRGYLPMDSHAKLALGSDATAQVSDETLKMLLQQKQDLTFQISKYEENIEKSKKGDVDLALISQSTKVQCHLRPNSGKGCVELVLRSTNNTVIKATIITAEFLFGSNESCMVYSQDASDTIIATFAPEKDVSTELHIQALVGHKMSTYYHVFELDYKLPKFSMYVPVKDFQKEPESSVRFRVTERVNRVAMWLNNSFNVGHKVDRHNLLDARFVSLRNGLLLAIHMSPENGGQLTIRVNNMEVAGEIIQDLCSFLTINELESVADFPQEFEEFKKVLMKVDEYNAVRLKLTAEMADSSQLVKALVIKAEDARILNDMKLMKKMYSSLYDVNRELIGEYIKRANNHNELLSALKEVNAMIQKAARLRIGAAKTKVITECRNSIKSNNIHSLFKIIRLGHLN